MAPSHSAGQRCSIHHTTPPARASQQQRGHSHTNANAKSHYRKVWVGKDLRLIEFQPPCHGLSPHKTPIQLPPRPMSSQKGLEKFVTFGYCKFCLCGDSHALVAGETQPRGKAFRQPDTRAFMPASSFCAIGENQTLGNNTTTLTRVLEELQDPGGEFSTGDVTQEGRSCC